MHQCCTSVTGGGSVANPTLENFVTKVQEVFQSSDLQERKAQSTASHGFIYPLSQNQINTRFGVTFQESDPLFDEVLTVKGCHQALSRAI